MDPITLAVVTSAVTTLATKVAEGTASAAGKDAWATARRLLGWAEDPPLADLPGRAAQRLQEQPALAQPLVQALRVDRSSAVGQLVGRIDAEKVTVIGGDVIIHGDFRM